MPNTTFVQARSVMEARTRPIRVVEAIDTFLDRVWEPRAVSGAELA